MLWILCYGYYKCYGYNKCYGYYKYYIMNIIDIMAACWTQWRWPKLAQSIA